MGGISDYQEEAWLNALLNGAADQWVSLHTADPGETGASEVTGGSYVRKQVPMDPWVTGVVDNTGAITWIGMPATTITYVGIWDAETTGHFLIGGLLTVPKTLNAGDTFQINAGDLDVTLD